MEASPGTTKNTRFLWWLIPLVVIALMITADLFKMRQHVERDRQFLIGTWTGFSQVNFREFSLVLSADGTFTEMGNKGTWTFNGEVVTLHFNGNDDGPTYYLDVAKRSLASHVPDGGGFTKSSGP
jgi:hypothetical protein